ncbi:MAG TPA: kelch repeat-containing protein, partial [Blastocatellia bacterium]|nr:kelch repeat-containing protein [Blastocatellia bacterium]
TWSVTGSLNTPRILHTATLLQNGKVLVAGGDDGKGGEFSSPLHTAELYDPATGMWSFAGNLNAAIQEHTATLLQNGKVLVVGGYGSGSAINNAEVYDPDTGTWSSVGSSSTNYRLYYSATLLADGRVLIVGGHDYGGGSLRKTVELYDPNTGRWSNTGQLNIRRMSHTATLLPNRKVLVAGGSLFSSLVTSELYDPDTGTWSFTDNLNTPRSDHTATLLPDGKVLIVGGLRSSAGNSFSLDSVELGYNFAAVATPAPYITMASVAGKRLWVEGENFVSGAVILINGEEQKTKNYALDPRSTLIGKKAGKKIKAGDKLQVRNPDGTLSEEFIFTGS